MGGRLVAPRQLLDYRAENPVRRPLRKCFPEGRRRIHICGPASHDYLLSKEGRRGGSCGSLSVTLSGGPGVA